MQYLPPIKAQQKAKGQPLKYTGAVAKGYDDKRKSSDKWKVEQRIIEEMLSELPQFSWVLDAPCGTGRWLDVCHRQGLIYRGLDISEDMIKQAAAKLGKETPLLRFTLADGKQFEAPQFAFARGDVLNCGLEDNSVDVALNIRITRWLSAEECQQMFREMQRIARKQIILTARVANHPYARPLAIFEAAMQDGWQLSDSVPGYQPEYRIFRFAHKSAVRNETPKQEADDSWVMKPYEGV